MFDGNQMINVMRLRRVVLMNQAVFTASPRSLNDQTTERIGDVASMVIR